MSVVQCWVMLYLLTTRWVGRVGGGNGESTYLFSAPPPRDDRHDVLYGDDARGVEGEVKVVPWC